MVKDDMQKMMAETSKTEIYREVVVFTLGRVIIVLFIVLTLFFLGMLIDGVVTGHSVSGGMPDWFYAVMCLFFVSMTYVVINFGNLVIKATSRSITVKYGIFKREIPWKNVVDFYLDESASLFAYGGYGIRIGRVNGKWRLVYNVLGGERVVLVLKKGRFQEFVFSTNDPDAVMAVVKRQVVDSKQNRGTYETQR